MPICQTLTETWGPATFEELDLFIDFVLSDVAEREEGKSGERYPSKRGNRPMRGIYVSRHGKTRLHESDVTERRYVCILALRRWGGMTEKEAVCTVAQQVLGPGVSATQIESLRIAFCEYNHPLKEHLLDTYWRKFLGWKQCLHEQAALDKVAPLPDGRTRIDFAADIYRAHKGEGAATRLRELASRILRNGRAECPAQ